MAACFQAVTPAFRPPSQSADRAGFRVGWLSIGIVQTSETSLHPRLRAGADRLLLCGRLVCRLIGAEDSASFL